MKMTAQYIAETNAYCRKIGMNPKAIPTSVAIFTNEDMEMALAVYKETISVTHFFAEKIIQLLDGIPLLVTITNQNGVILKVVGHGKMKQEVGRLGFARGLQVTVKDMGTNAINLSLEHHRGAVEVVGDAHYHCYLHKSACYGMAFKNTTTKEVLGTISIMTDVENQDPMITTMLSTVVDAIERELVLREQNKKLHVLHQVMMDNNHYGVLTTDLDGIVVEYNIRAEILLGKKCRQVLGKPASELELIGSRVQAVLTEKKRFDGIHIMVEQEQSQQVFLFDAFPIYDDRSEVIGAYAQFRDITDIYDMQKRFQYLANHDEQTELPNRRHLIEKLTTFLEQGRPLAVVHMNLDRFKLVNDTIGHADGDVVLKSFGQRLAQDLGASDLIARGGGDEFIMLVACESRADAQRIGESLLRSFREPFRMQGYDFHITASIGMAISVENGTTADELLINSNTAMSFAKKNGKNQFVLYADEMNPQAHAKILLETSLRKAIDKDELILYYQPKVDIKTGDIIGVEALVRWNHPEKGMISPGEFIPLAEETGLIAQLDEWVLWAACRQNKKWQDMGMPSFNVAINLSSNQFASDTLPDLVQSVLQTTGLAPEYVELEITETMTMDVEHAIPTLKKLSALGVKISIDDFGTGYSSMSYLTKFAIDRLKIDQSFVWSIEKSKSDSDIVVTIIRMAHSLGLKVIAEGVEDAKQLHFLHEHGCDEVQGYFFSKPIAAEELEVRFLQLQQEINDKK